MAFGGKKRSFIFWECVKNVFERGQEADRVSAEIKSGMESAHRKTRRPTPILLSLVPGSEEEEKGGKEEEEEGEEEKEEE